MASTTAAATPHGRDVDFDQMVLRVPAVVQAGKPRVMTPALPDGNGAFKAVRFLADPMEVMWGLRPRFGEVRETTSRWEVKAAAPRGGANFDVFSRAVARLVRLLVEHSTAIFGREKSAETVVEMMYPVLRDTSDGKIKPPEVCFPVFRHIAEKSWSTTFLSFSGAAIPYVDAEAAVSKGAFIVPEIELESVTLMSTGKVFVQCRLLNAMVLPRVAATTSSPAAAMRDIALKFFPGATAEELSGGAAAAVDEGEDEVCEGADERPAKRRCLRGESFTPASTALSAAAAAGGGGTGAAEYEG